MHRSAADFEAVALRGYDGLFVPLQFVSVIDDVTLHFETDDDGQPRCIRYEVTGTPEVDTRRLPLREYIRRSIGAAAGTREELTPPFRPRRPETERIAAWDAIVRRPVGRPPGTGVLGLRNLTEVARVSREGAPHGTKAVMKRFKVSNSTAQRAKRKARAAGLHVD